MIDPANASIDGVIQWLRNQRRLNPRAPLSELVNVSAVSPSRLTDMACIDLIERKRIGQTTRVEDLLREVPILATMESAKLDLIDAELCVQMELGQTIDISHYAVRFPDLASSIEALFKLSHERSTDHAPLLIDSATSPGTPGMRPSVGTLMASHDDVDSLAHASGYASSPEVTNARRTSRTTMLDGLIQPPPWFIQEQVQASSERSCLIRGRDSNRNRAVALKVIRLSNAIKKDDIEVLLASVEAASMVRHPAWVTPDIAAVENQSLAVIRPWIFGIRWDQARRLASPQTRLRDLARVGYALQSAHDTTHGNIHATHGGLHLNNLLVNADGEVQIVDAGACIQPAAGDMLGSTAVLGDCYGATDQRRQSDVRSLCALLRVVTGGGPSAEGDFRRRATILDRMCQDLAAEPNEATACSRLADAATKLADGNLSEQESRPLSSAAKSFWSRLFQRTRAASDSR